MVLTESKVWNSPFPPVSLSCPPQECTDLSIMTVSTLAKPREALPLLFGAQLARKQVADSCPMSAVTPRISCSRSFSHAVDLKLLDFLPCEGSFAALDRNLFLQQSPAPLWDHSPFHFKIVFFYYFPNHANWIASGAQIFSQQKKTSQRCQAENGIATGCCVCQWSWALSLSFCLALSASVPSTPRKQPQCQLALRMRKRVPLGEGKWGRIYCVLTM